jgi:hypothetical protein
MEIEPRPKRRRRGADSHQSDGSEPDPAPQEGVGLEEDPDETNNESATTVGDAMHTVDPRVRPCQRAALNAYTLHHAEPRAKIVMACGTGKPGPWVTLPF